MGTPDIEQQQEQPKGEQRVNFADDLSQSDAASLSENDSRAASSKEDTTTKRDATPIEQMQALLFSRVVVGLFLIAATVAAGVTTYVMVADTEDTNFENRVSAHPSHDVSIGFDHERKSHRNSHNPLAV